jgi:hypothetical protein
MPAQRRLTVVALIALLAALLTIPAPARAAARGSLAPTTLAPGGTISVSVSGFRAGERIDRWVTRPDSGSESIFPYLYADASGNAGWTYTLAGDAQAGAWTMAARGVRSNERLGLAFSVTFGDQAAPEAPRAVALPASGAPGDSFSFSATGFDRGEQVDVWLNGPQDQNLAGPNGVRATSEGIAYWEWRAPADVSRGAWRMIAVGRTSRVQYLIPFEIR